MEITVARSIRHWWVFVLRGSVFILLGIYLLASPVSGYLTLSFLFGLIILLTGVAELIRAYQDRKTRDRGWHLFIGLMDLLIGLILISHLVATMVILRFILGFYFLFKGATLLTFHHYMRNAWLMFLGGVIVLICVVLIWFNPAFGAASVILFTSTAFLVTGLLNVLLGLRLKRSEPFA